MLSQCSSCFLEMPLPIRLLSGAPTLTPVTGLLSTITEHIRGGRNGFFELPDVGGVQNSYRGGGLRRICSRKLSKRLRLCKLCETSVWAAVMLIFGRGIAVDSGRNAYITGKTSSPNFPITRALQNTYGGGDADVFVTKLGLQGDVLYYSDLSWGCRK